MKCPTCGAELPEDSNYCDEDGTPLRVVQPRDAREPDHVELAPSPNFAGVTHHGIRKSENQDHMALAVVEQPLGNSYIAVVCDGVSGSQGAATASAAASKTACAALEHAIQASPNTSISSLIRIALAEANDAVCSLTYDHDSRKHSPETTIVAAVVTDRHAVIGWAGDSRAYWFTESDAAQITRDHSWVNDVVDAGLMGERDALQSPLAHAIVHCLGGSVGTPEEPLRVSVIRCTLPEGARLLLCTDGLYLYAKKLEDLAALMRPETGETPLATAQRLIQYAITRGGHDNITAVILST